MTRLSRGFDTALDAQGWLRQQDGVIEDLFERAAEELQVSGIRLLAGSLPPNLEDVDCGKRIKLVPLRFAGSNDNESLSLSFLATTRRGPPRYVVELEVSGAFATQALRNLATKHPDIWRRAYLGIGLWIGEGANAQPLNDLSQLTEGTDARLSIAGVFLHSDLTQTIQQGLMLLGTLYRCVLDELSAASKMERLYTQLSNRPVNYMPRFQRKVRP